MTLSGQVGFIKLNFDYAMKKNKGKDNKPKRKYQGLDKWDKGELQALPKTLLALNNPRIGRAKSLHFDILADQIC